MITKAELHRAAQAQGLRFDQAEKDYVILWILSAISSNEIASTQWAFKGGTCLRHCFYRGFRFSEDIDFSCQASEANVLNAQSVLKQVALEVQEASGILISRMSGLPAIKHKPKYSWSIHSEGAEDEGFPWFNPI